MRTTLLAALTTGILVTSVVYGAVTFASSTHAIQYKESTYGLRVTVESRGPRPFSTNQNDHTVQINDTPIPFTFFNIEYFYAPPTADGFGEYYLAANLLRDGQHVQRGDTVTLVLKDVDGNLAGTHTIRCVKPRNPYWATECR